MTVLTGSAAAIKYVLFFFNLLFVITGIIILSVGSVVQGVYHNFSEFLEANFFSVPAFLIAIGAIIFFIAFFGCCGAVKENYCMVLTFSCLMVLVFILELAAGISGYVLRGQTQEVVERQLSSSMQFYGVENKTNAKGDVTFLWDEVQRDFTCCGVHNYTDWVIHPNVSYVPASCCPTVAGVAFNQTCVNGTGFYPTGCVESFGNFIRSHAVSLGGAGIGLCVVQFLGIFFACYVAKQIKNRQYGMAN